MTWARRSKNKLGNIKVELGGYSFASKLEASVFTILKAREQAGEIEVLQVQDHVYLTDARIGYIPDFKCLDKKTGKIFWVEAKGFPNDKWPMKKKLWKFYGPGRLEIFTGTYDRPKLSEVIEVKEVEAGLKPFEKKDEK